MTEQAEFYDSLARHGEIKKTQRDEFSPPQTRQHPMEHPLPLPHKPTDASDLPPSGGIIQRRRRGRVIAPIPTNQAQQLDGETITRNHTRRGFTKPNGTDHYILESIDHKGEPPSKDKLRLLKHFHGRTRGIIMHAEKNRKG